jgi:outer membrane protein
MRNRINRILCSSLIAGFLVVECLSIPVPAFAQPKDPVPPSSSMTLKQAIEFALAHYPAVREALARVAASQSGIDLAETSYLPQATMGIQGSNGTFNNVSGMFFPSSFFQPIAGPDLGRRSYSSAWGSATGIILQWEPIDFGLRSATVGTAQAYERGTLAETELTKLNVALGTGLAYLQLVMAQESIKVFESNVNRRRVFAETIGVLVKHQLRPGVDLSRAKAELARAQTQRIEAEQTERVAMTIFALALGLAGNHVTVNDPVLASLPTEDLFEDSDLAQHPLATVQLSAIDIPKKRQEALGASWAPKFNLQSTLYSRGSGWDAQGNRTDNTDGLLPDVPNWAVGLTATFSLTDFAPIRAEKRIEQYKEEAEIAKYDQVLQELRAQQARSRATLELARQIAEHIPIQITAAKETETQARAQFKAGLATVVEVADAQRLIVQAALDDAQARLGVWQALMSLAGSQGTIQPFIDLLDRTSRKNP